MWCKKANWKNEAISAIIIWVFGFLATLIFNSHSRNSLDAFLASGLISANFWLFLAKGNEYIARTLDDHYSWINQTKKRFYLGLSCLVVYSVLVVVSLMAFHEWLLDVDFGNWEGSIIFSLIITIGATALASGKGFLDSWRKAELDAAQLRAENLASQFAQLKNQVNPHFLFNSLNALTNLVYEDQDQAAKFIKKLSKVYRYVLDHQDKEVVSLSSELNFADDYIFLQKIRFEENLRIEKELYDVEDVQIVPMSLQMLLENAIKHNVISRGKPLTIRLYIEEDYLVVSNNLQKKSTREEEESGIGLNNIKSRYNFLSDAKVIVNETDDLFEVRLPLLRELTPAYA